MKLKIPFIRRIALAVFLSFVLGKSSLLAQRPAGSVPTNPTGKPIHLNTPVTTSQEYTAQLENSRDLRSHLATLVADQKITAQDTDVVITSEHISSISGVHHIYYRQAINGIEVMGTEASVHIANNSKVAVAHNRNLIKNINASLKSSAASLTARKAIEAIANQMNYGPISNLTEITSKSSNGTTLYTKGGISTADIPAKQLYYLVPNDGIRMIWEIAIQEVNSSDWWNFRIDASSGNIIDKNNFTVSCNIGDGHDHSERAYLSMEDDYCDDDAFNTMIAHDTVSTTSAIAADGASYTVYALPIESPYFGVRTVEVDPANPVASPFGWHDTNGVTGADFTVTTGNNTVTVDDINANNSGGTAPEGGGSLVFNHPFDATQTQSGINVPLFNTGNRSLNASITNTFYWTNIIHDITYHYGFDEASGNFQTNNYGNGGIPGDEVLGDVQDGSDTCNANFGTPQDGFSPRMQMFICNSNDSSYDNLVIVHEYAHGISTRLTGGAANSGGLNNQEQQGEGWSDYYGYMYTMSASNFDSTRAVGTFLISGGPNNPGIRSFPYSPDMAVNPQTYQDLINLGNGNVAPHPVGEIWATMLYDLTQSLIDVYGFDSDLYTGTGGNNISLALVTEGLKLQPASPGFVNSRDAILLADQLLFNGANQCIIWESFANRGLGFSADQGSSNVRGDGAAAFDVPPISLTVSETDICLANGVVSLGGGIVNGGTYSGPGVTDNGDGASFSFDPLVAGAGTHTISYTAIDCNGSPGTDTDTITVTEVLPELIACPDVTLALGADGTAIYDPFQEGLQVDIVGGDDGSNAQGFTVFFVPGNLITQTTTISFDWELITAATDLPAFDSFAYVLGADVLPISPNENPIENGSFSIEVPAGQNFGFGIITADNTFGAATATVTNFNPGYFGQFDPLNWQELNQVADGTAAFSGTPAPSLVSCGEITTALSHSVFTCLDIGTTTAVTITVTDSFGNEDTCVADVTVTGGTLNTTTFAGGAWSNGIPTGTSMAVINADYDTATPGLGDINACACEIEANQTLTIRDGNFLNVAGNITVDGTLIVENEGSVVQIDETAITTKTNNGTIEVRKTTPLLEPRFFTVLSSPMSASTREDVYQSADRAFEIVPSLFTPHPDVTTAINFVDVNFDYFAPASNLVVGQGYLVFPQAVTADTGIVFNHMYTEGTLNSGTINYPLVYNGPATENNFNVVGNPYASAIDTDMLIMTNDAINQVYFWEHLTQPSADNPGDNPVNFSMNDISIYNLTGGIVAVNGGAAPERYMVSGQGFGVIANQSELNEPLTFTNAMRVAGNNGTVRSAENSSENKIWLRLSDKDQTLGSTTLIGFVEEATPDFDKGFDSKRVESTISLYSEHTDEQQLSIQGREVFNEEITVILGFESKIEERTNFIISIDNLSGPELLTSDVYLKDNLLDIIVNLKEEDYSFTANPSNNPGRFTLSFTEETVLGTDDNALATQLSIYPNPSNGAITLSYAGDQTLVSATILDVNGKIIRSMDLSSFENSQNFDLSAMATGMYFMQIEMQNTVITKKILLK